MTTQIIFRIAILSQAGQLSDVELIARIKALTQRECEATAVLIAHLAVLDERRLYRAEGYPSLFVYCTQALHLSEHAAYGRIEAARAARKFPIILELLADGSLNLTTVTLLAQHLTDDNHRELLRAATHKSKAQVEELIVALWPKPEVPSSIRKLPAPSQTAATLAAQSQSAPNLTLDLERGLEASRPASFERATLTPARRAMIEALAPQRYKIQFTASAELCEKLRQAQDLLRHQIPDGDLEQVMDRALTALLENLTRQKFAATTRPRSKRQGKSIAAEGNPDNGSRAIPAEVRRAVRERDGQQCAFVSKTGHRCTELAFLEFHHVVPYSLGGQATVENIQLRCRAHNAYEAEQYFGQPLPYLKKNKEVVRGPGLQEYRFVSRSTRSGPSRIEPYRWSRSLRGSLVG